MAGVRNLEEGIRSNLSQLPEELVTDLREVLRSISKEALLVSLDGSIKSSSGRKLSWYVDLRRITLRSDFLRVFGEVFWGCFQERWPFQVAGLEMASIPLLSSILIEGERRGRSTTCIVVRKERKTYGLSRDYEGSFTKDMPTILVDDILNTGTSLGRVKSVVEELQGSIEAAFVVLDFETDRGKTWRQKAQIPVISLAAPRNLGINLPRRINPPKLSIEFEDAWSFKASKIISSFLAPKSGPTLSNGFVYFGADDGNFYALQSCDGKVQWMRQASARSEKGIWSTPLVWGERIYFGSYAGTFHCLHATTGAEIWNVAIADWIGSSPCVNTKDGTIYIGLEFSFPGSRGALAAICSNSGEIKWQFNVPEFQHGTPSWSESNGCIVFGSNDGVVYCVDDENGRELWSLPLGSALRGGIALFDGGLGACGTDGGDVVIFDLASGTIARHWKIGGQVYSAPVIVGEHCIVSCTDKHVYFFNLLTGRLTKSVYVGSRCYGRPTVWKDSVLVGTTAGLLLEISLTSLRLIGSRQLAGPITCPIVVDAETGTFLALSSAGELFAVSRHEVASTSVSAPSIVAQADGIPERKLIGNIKDAERVVPEIISGLAFVLGAGHSTPDYEVLAQRQAVVDISHFLGNKNARKKTSRLSVQQAPKVDDLLSQIGKGTALALEYAFIIHVPANHRFLLPPRSKVAKLAKSRTSYHAIVEGQSFPDSKEHHPEPVRAGEVWKFAPGVLCLGLSSSRRLHILVFTGVSDSQSSSQVTAIGND